MSRRRRCNPNGTLPRIDGDACGADFKEAALVVGMVLLVAACTRAERWIGVGDVVSVDEGQAVTIRHEEVAGLLAPATTRFAADRAELLAGLQAGSRVRFELTRAAGRLALTRIRLLSEGNPGIHDHTPHHGGVVAMAGMVHVEARAERDGRVEIYLTDRWRRPLELDETSGTVTLRLPDGRPNVALRADGDALRAAGPKLEGREVNAHVLLVHGSQPIDVHFVLPLASQGQGAAGVPPEGCVASESSAGEKRRPRCVVTFSSPVAALAVLPDGSAMLVAAVGFGVSVWRLPSGEFARGFAPPPPVKGPADEPPHVEAANAIAVHPDGTSAVVAYEGRLIRYSVATGEVLDTWSGPGGVIRDVCWSPDGGELLLSAFYDRSATLLDGAKGGAVRRFPVEREGAGVAFSAAREVVAVGSEAGSVAVFERRSGTRLALLPTSRRTARVLAFAGERLLSGGDDGILRSWATIDPGSMLESAAAAPIHHIALSPDGARVATAGLEGAIRIHDVATVRDVETLAWHDAQITGLGWTSEALVSADGKGRVALWDF